LLTLAPRPSAPVFRTYCKTATSDGDPMSMGRGGLEASRKVTINGVDNIFYGQHQIGEGRRKFDEQDDRPNLQADRPHRSQVAAAHAAFKVNWRMGESYQPQTTRMTKNGARSQKNKGNLAIVTLAAGLPADAADGAEFIQRHNDAECGRGTLFGDHQAGDTELKVLLDPSGNSGSVTKDCTLTCADGNVVQVGFHGTLTAVTLGVRVLGATATHPCAGRRPYVQV